MFAIATTTSITECLLAALVASRPRDAKPKKKGCCLFGSSGPDNDDEMLQLVLTEARTYRYMTWHI